MTRQLAISPSSRALARLKTLSMSLALILTGCATPVLQSTVDVPSQFAAAPAAETEPDVAWWESFGDPVLTELIGRAARENRDIKIAVERVRAARGGETISRSSLWPSIGSTAGAVDSSTGYGDAVKRDVPDVETGTAALSVSWELDLSGRLRAGPPRPLRTRWPQRTLHAECACSF